MSADASSDSEGSSHGQILRSSALIGSSQVLILGISIVRTKLLAVLLGPAGYGLMTVYWSIGDLASSIASLGVDRSGVRQIAVSAGSGDSDRIARTATVLRRLSVVLGLVGAGVVVILSPSISTVTFGDRSYSGGIAVLSLMVLAKVVAGGQAALIQGLRRIGDLAMLGIVGALGGTAASVALVYFMGASAVAYAVVGVAVVALCASWWYSRPSRVGYGATGQVDFGQESRDLIKLGFAFMASGFLTLGASYVVRMMIIRFDGLQAAGYYQAAWALGSLYVGMILQAMGADFYPRLSAAIADSTTANRLVNEQTHVSLLLAGPGIVATLSASALLLTLFYSADFVAAVGILHYICLGMALRVITWPIGYIIVAQGRRSVFFATELAWAIANVSLSWLCIVRFGLIGVGVAFFLSYVFHWIMIYPIVRRMTGFRWTATNRRVGAIYLLLAAAVFAAVQVLTPLQALAIGILVSGLSAAYSLKLLASLVPLEQLPKPLRRAAKLVARGSVG